MFVLIGEIKLPLFKRRRRRRRRRRRISEPRREKSCNRSWVLHLQDLQVARP